MRKYHGSIFENFGIYCGYRSVKNMKTRLIIDGNAVYEIDEECVRKRKVPEKCQTAQKLQMQRKRDAESGLEKKSER